MENDEKFQSHLNLILENPFNKRCFDCLSENPQWVSINNGILICLRCCAYHRELGPTFSVIKSLSMDHLTQNDLSYIKTGGNNKLKNFFEGFNINNENFSIGEKYKTKASVYYRALLKNLIEGGELPDPPSLYEGSQLELIEPVLPQKEKTEGWSFGYFQTTAKNFLGTAMEKTNIGLAKVNEKIKETHLKESLAHVVNKSKEIGSGVYEKSKVVGSEVIHKSKEIGNEIYHRSKDLGSDAVVKSKEYGKIISEKSIAFGNQVAEKSKVISNEVINQTKKSYEQVSKGLASNKKPEENINFEEMKDIDDHQPKEHLEKKD